MKFILLAVNILALLILTRYIVSRWSTIEGIRQLGCVISIGGLIALCIIGPMSANSGFQLFNYALGITMMTLGGLSMTKR